MAPVRVSIDGVHLGVANEVSVVHEEETAEYATGLAYGQRVVIGKTIDIDLIDFVPNGGKGVEKRWGIRNEDDETEWFNSREKAEGIFNYLKKQEYRGYELVSQTVPTTRTVDSTNSEGW